MSSPRRPSPAVYRRRRLVVVTALVVVIGALGWLVIAQPWRGAGLSPAAVPSYPSASGSPSTTPADTAPTADTSGAATPSVQPSSEDQPPAVAACAGSDVTVEALTDKTDYASGEQPQLSIRLTNTSQAPCTINVGTTTQRLTVSSGSDVWWRSTDCQQTPSDMEVTLAAGQSVTSATPVVWDRTRSSVSTCNGGRPAAPAGEASYRLSVSIGGFDSAQDKQFFLR